MATCCSRPGIWWKPRLATKGLSGRRMNRARVYSSCARPRVSAAFRSNRIVWAAARAAVGRIYAGLTEGFRRPRRAGSPFFARCCRPDRDGAGERPVNGGGSRFRRFWNGSNAIVWKISGSPLEENDENVTS